jgi:hypothetical protein
MPGVAAAAREGKILTCLMDRDENQRQPGGGASMAASAAGPAALLLPWRRVGRRVAAQVGASGVWVWFGRALRTVAARHAFLGMHGERQSIEALLRAYEADLARVDAAAAAAADTALMETFTSQLSALIGDALTARLLADARRETDGRDGPQDAQEHSND